MRKHGLDLCFSCQAVDRIRNAGGSFRHASLPRDLLHAKRICRLHVLGGQHNHIDDVMSVHDS